MRFALFYHSLVSDWNHGNAHFLRGIVRELLDRGHDVQVFEPQNGWSRQNLIAEHGPKVEQAYRRFYPQLESTFYDLATLDLDEALDGADVVLVHEWNEAELVERIGEHRAAGGTYRLLFHDTHHRCVTAPQQMLDYDLTHFDGVLAFGAVIRDHYLEHEWAARAWTWHEAADVRLFRPLRSDRQGEFVWIGNWGDGERTEELEEFLLTPIRQLRLAARVHGVRYPNEGRRALAAAGIEYGGWLANYRVPETFARYAFTAHVPRRPYREQLPGIPTIRVFEALACGIPLITAPWEDSEHLFRPGQDFLVARNGRQMQKLMQQLLRDRALAEQLIRNGLETIRKRHTCGHRVDELLAIVDELGLPNAAATAKPAQHSVEETSWQAS